MIVNKSMFPLQTGFGVISKMQDRFATLQMQLHKVIWPPDTRGV